MQRISLSEDFKDRFWYSFEQRRLGFYRSFEYRFKKVFKEEAKKIGKAYKEDGFLGINEFFENRILEWDRLLNGLYIGVIEEFGNATSDNLEKKEFDPFKPEILQWVKLWSVFRATLITGVSKKIANKIISKGIEEAKTVDEIAQSLEPLYIEDCSYRAMRMARTEVIMCSNYGSLEGAKSTGLSLLKVWITARDERVRDTHVVMDGEAVVLDDVFSNGLSFPGDPNGDASETIHCRCVMNYQPKM